MFDYLIGAKVMHKTYGQGTILSVGPLYDKNQCRLIVKFQNFNESKNLMAPQIFNYIDYVNSEKRVREFIDKYYELVIPEIKKR